MAGKKAHDEMDDIKLENTCLKNNNTELAEELSDKSAQCNKLQNRVEKLEHELITVEMQISMFREGFRHIMDRVVPMSLHLAKIGEEVEYMLAQSGRRAKVVHSPTADVRQTNKTRAVKPMVDGHTISRPTVKLSRVSTEQLVQLNAGVRRVASNGVSEDVPEHIQNQAELYSRADTDEEDVDEGGDASGQTSAGRASESSRLETLHEVDEPPDSYDESGEQTVPGAASRGPLISGVFKDVRVYISPMRGAVSRKWKSTSSQTCGRSTGARRSAPSTSGDGPAEVKPPAVSSTTNAPADCSMNDVSMLVEVDASAYQEGLDDSKIPEASAYGSKNYDPLEGSSVLLSNINNGESSLSMFQLAPSALANKTSTPLVPVDLERRERTCFSNANKENLHADPQDRYVTRRGGNRLANRRPSIDDDLFSFMSCRVILNRLSPTELTEGRAVTPEVPPRSESDRSCSSSVTEGKRSLRSKRPMKSLKEPSLRGKMRRQR